MPNNKNNLNKALSHLLRPLARLCLHFGISFREFCDLSKTAFITVATEDYGVHGRPTNVSRIAAMTGLTRKEISRLRKRIGRDAATQIGRGTPVREVLKAWHTAKEFVDQKGQPRVLPMEGKRGSFHSLVRQFAGDIPDGAMRKELERIGAAELKGDALRPIPQKKAEVDAAAARASAMLEQAEAQLEAISRSVRY
ncbi:MAG: hypothetical protein KJN77_02880 [Gammaproteobacteria bacterium]|nr:hypothetical protein [Gammaproteobacteria bacterium]